MKTATKPDPKVLINTVKGFTSNDLSKTILTKVSQRNNQLAATDGHKLIVVHNATPVELPEELKVSPELGTYPNYERILPRHFDHVQTLTVSQAKNVIKVLKTLIDFSKSLLKKNAMTISPNARTSINTMDISFRGSKISVKITGKARFHLDEPIVAPYYSDRERKTDFRFIEAEATAVNVDTGTIDKPTGLLLSPALKTHPSDSFDYRYMTYNANYLIQCLESVVKLSSDDATIYIRFDSEVRSIVIDNHRNDPTVTVMLMQA